MASYSSDRRSLLKIFGSVGATCAYPFASDELYGQTAPEHQHTVAAAVVKPHFLNDQDFATVSRIADLIIPPTDTPGAIAAGVPEYIDLVIGRNTDQQLVVADGLRWLDRVSQKRFLELSEKEQLAILEPLCAAADSGDSSTRPRNVQFFALIKSLTADGYYTSRAGLMEELRYKGNAARPNYAECSSQS